MTQPEGPVTLNRARAQASDLASDPATLVEIVHPGFNSDPRNGGFAFACDNGLFLFSVSGRRCWAVDPETDEGRRQEVEQFWHQEQRRNRALGLGDLSVLHRAALAAVVSGVTSVADLPASARAGMTDVARADYLLVVLRRRVKDRTEAAILRVLAADDRLLEGPAADRRAYPCPLCARPAIDDAWEYISVCDDCYPRTQCADGRLVTGYNTGFGGGFEARHVDDRTLCEQVTRDRLAWVAGHECHIDEGRFGDVFVGVERPPEQTEAPIRPARPGKLPATQS